MTRERYKADEKDDQWPPGSPLFAGGDEPYDKVESIDLFHIGQSYEDKAATTIQCTACGSTEFNVGKGSFFTAIRCVKCEWETCIHNG